MTQTASSASLASNSSNAEAKRSRHRNSKKGASAEDLDEDEAAIVREEDDEDDEASAPVKKGTTLKVQPTIISGGLMRDYQLEGLNWMIRLQENGINGILADEMGLGKTLQSISIIAYMHQHLGITGPHLIMVPKSTLSNWCNEFNRFCPTIRVMRFHGSKEEREEIVHKNLQPTKTQETRAWDVCITTYEVVNLERNSLCKIAWRYLVIDEAHRLKNEASQFSQTVRQLQTQYRLLLTGTPLQNNLHELWALLNFLLPEVFSSSEQFDDWFNLDVDDTEAKQRIIGQLHKLLRPFMLRRLKADVEKSLPPKSETILFIGMSSQQKEVYKKVLLRDIDTINSGGQQDSKAGRTAILNIVMQLRKCCNHPYLFPGIEDRTLDPLGDHLYQNCGKMVLLHRLLQKLKERDHRVLLFSQMTRMLDILEDYFNSQGYRYCRIDGNTTYEEREDRIQDFNREGSDRFIFLLSTRAGGLGINLQTADTVILYDSDWNPQADLQAQDRAHRIGQKKPVQVFRLVTDETVEVKVVERAQQKLKLDAMVVQQGRLQEKEKKMSKQDLLDTLRFGADKIFRSKESTISDADIDLILEEGRKRTVEMTEKLQIAEKGDMYDFRLDGGMKTQEFDGVDYSNKQTREAELNTLATLQYIDPGKRERKAVATYAESIARATAEEGDKKQKLPRHLRLPKMEDWQFYSRDRLNELHAEENRLFDVMVEKGELPQTTNKMIVLPQELHDVKTRLLEEAFDWSRVIFNNFIRASAKYGRFENEKIARDIQMPADQVKRYAETYWSQGPEVFGVDEWESKLKQIEKGEKKIEEIQRLTDATAKLISQFKNPWEELTFRTFGTAGKIFNTAEDRFLLCLTHLHGFGSWDQVRSSLRRCDRFRFDFYLQSCTSEMLGKRCELLMKAAERELQEKERKIKEGDAKKSNEKATAFDRQQEIEKSLRSEERKLSLLRDQLNKAKSGHLPGSKNPPKDSAKDCEMAGVSSTSSAPSLSSATKKRPAASGGAKDGVLKPVKEKDLPELCRILSAAGTISVDKVIERFMEAHKDGDVSKRQLEIKIKEVGEKVSHVWRVRPEFQKYLDGAASAASDMLKSATKKPPAKRAKNGAADSGKRKRDEDAQYEHKEIAGPKKAKGAFAIFVVAKKKDATSQLPADYPPEQKSAQMKKILKEMYEGLRADEKLIYETQANEDQLR